MNHVPLVFDRKLLQLRRDEAAAKFSEFAFLKNYLADHLADRLLDINRTFPVALDLGCHTGELAKAISEKCETIVQSDYSIKMLEGTTAPALALDEEFLPFAPESFDAVISAGSLHTTNDLPGALSQILTALKPDGLFLATLFGGETLKELRESFSIAELEIEGGISPRVFPFIDMRDAGTLLQRAGFKLPVIDSFKLQITYENAFALMRDLKGMAENSIMVKRRKNLSRRDTMTKMAEVYHHKFSDSEGRITSTFEIITLTAWKHHKSQQKPLERGSGETNLRDALEE